MFDGPREIIVLDGHVLRGTAISALLAEHAKEFALSVTWTDKVPEDSTGKAVFAEGTAACVYVIGGRSLVEPEVELTLRRCLLALTGRPLVVLVDEIDAEGIEIAIAHEVRGVIPTWMPSEFAVAAIHFIQAGGHYYPNSKSIPHGIEHATQTAVAQNGADSRPLANGTPCSHIPSPTEQHVPESCTCLSPNETASDDEPSIGVQVGKQTVHLTPRQIDVMDGLERGLSNKAIGRELNLSESTVKLHVRHLMRKLQVDNRTKIAVLALSSHLRS